MPAPGADRNLLFGMLALQMDFIQKDALLQAMQAWVFDKSKPLGDILVAQSALRAERRTLLDALVEEHLRQHDNDAQKSLAALSSVGSAREDLKQITDPDVQASLVQVSAARGEDVHATRAPSVGASTSAGVRFRILRPHARGGLGEVFVARDEELGREVALKEIQNRHADDPNSRSRFVLEAEITGGLEHPGIVPVYGLGQYADGRPFYAMRFIRGDSLKDAIERYHRPQRASGVSLPNDPSERAVEFRKLLGRFIDVCNAIAYAHSRGVLHRDLKPGNIMLGKYGETLVVDWGLAKSLGTKEDAGVGEAPLQPSTQSGTAETVAGSALGTPQFMSPEQAAGRLDLLGPASDVYSLGATLYVLLTGKPAFTDPDVGAILQKVQRGDFPPPRQVQRDAPKALEAICLKAMALKPEDRYATPRALADDVENWLADEPVTAFREPLRTRLRRWARRHRVVVAVAAALLVTAVPVLAISTLLIGREKQRTEAVLAESQASLYFNRIALVDREWQANNIRRIEELLGDCPPRLRQWEWHYFQRLVQGDGTLTLDNHDKPEGAIWTTDALSFSPDGQRLLTASAYSVRVWDLAAGTRLLTLPGAGPTGCAAYSPDGTRIATATTRPGNREPSEAVIWDAQTGKEILTIAGAGVVRALAFSPDGKRLLTAAVAVDPHDRNKTLPGKVAIWDAVTGKEILTFDDHPAEVHTVTFGPDGKWVALGAGPEIGDSLVKVWDTATGKELATLAEKGRDTQPVSFSADGRRVAAVNWASRSAGVWDTLTGKELLKLRKGFDPFGKAKLSPDGRYLATTDRDHTVSLWSVATGDLERTFRGSSQPVYQLAFSSDGRRLAAGGVTRQGVAVRIFDTLQDQESHDLPQQFSETVQVPGLWSTCLAFSPDGTKLAVPRNGWSTTKEADGEQHQSNITLLDSWTGRVLSTLQGPGITAQDVAYSPDGKYLAVASTNGYYRPSDHLFQHHQHVVNVWDPATGRLLHTWQRRSPQLNPGPGTAVAFSPDSRLLAAAGPEESVQIRDLATGQEAISLKGHKGRVRSLAFSPDGKSLCSGGEDAVKCWDVATGRERFSYGNGGVITAVAYRPDGKQVAVGGISGNNNGIVTLRDPDTGVVRWSLAHPRWVESLAYSPDGQRLATLAQAKEDRGVVHLWNPETGQLILTLACPVFGAKQVAYSPDGRRLAVIGTQGRVVYWDATWGAEFMK